MRWSDLSFERIFLAAWARVKAKRPMRGKFSNWRMCKFVCFVSFKWISRIPSNRFSPSQVASTCRESLLPCWHKLHKSCAWGQWGHPSQGKGGGGKGKSEQGGNHLPHLDPSVCSLWKHQGIYNNTNTIIVIVVPGPQAQIVKSDSYDWGSGTRSF